MSQKISVTDRISLHSPDEKFCTDLYNIIQTNQNHFSKFMDWPKYVSKISDTREFIYASALSHQQGESKTYIICYDNDVVGVLSLNQIDKSNKTAYIGYWLDSGHCGKGIITNSINCLVDHYREDDAIRRFVIKCSTHNVRSNNVAVRCGFLHEGILKKAESINGIFYDQNVYARIC